MKMFIWLSYDLGIQGDYNHMYAWLDNHGAIECGDSFAYVKYSIPKEVDDDSFLNMLKRDLEKSISFKPGDRVYVVRYSSEKDSYMGRFIIGKRRAAPWDGYGDNKGDDTEDGRE